MRWLRHKQNAHICVGVQLFSGIILTDFGLTTSLFLLTVFTRQANLQKIPAVVQLCDSRDNNICHLRFLVTIEPTRYQMLVQCCTQTPFSLHFPKDKT